MRIIVNNISSHTIIGGFDSKVADVHKLLRQYLRVRPANYSQMLHSMRSQGNHGWDGFTYFFSAKGHFPTGFLPLVLNYMKEIGVSVTLEDKRENLPVFKAGDLNISTPLGPLAPHQIELLNKTKNYITSCTKTHIWNVWFPRGIWDAATNARKTAAAGALIQNIENPRAIMLVNDQKLLKQHYDYYKTVFTGKGELGFITSAKDQPGSILTLAMIRTLHNRLKASVTVQRNLHDRYNILICDELHDYAGREAVYVINKINAGLRIGMSGTPLDGSDKVGKFRLIGMFGEVLHTISKRYLMDNGYSLIPLIRIYHNPTECRAISYAAELAKVVTESVERAELVSDIIMKFRSRRILITFYERKHGELMYNTFIERYPQLAHLADWVHGDHANKIERIASFVDNKKKYLFGSTILQQGLNISDIEMGINAQGEKSHITLSQWLGRFERLDGVSTHFMYADFWDNGTYCSKHSRKRIRFYKSEDLPEPIVFKYPARKDGTPIIQ